MVVDIMALRITPGNTADSTVLDEVTRHLAGKPYADKGCVGRELFKRLWQRGLHLITSIRRNMRNHLMPLADKATLRKRFLIETVLDILKCEVGLEHPRHRSVINAMVHVLSCLVAYAFRPGKPSVSPAAQEITAYPWLGLADRHTSPAISRTNTSSSTHSAHTAKATLFTPV